MDLRWRGIQEQLVLALCRGSRHVLGQPGVVVHRHPHQQHEPVYTSIGGDAARERYWNGFIDNVFIFDGALSQSEMNSIINNPNGNLLGTVPVPEIDPAAMGSVLALVTGVLGLMERRRLKAA